MFNKKKEVKKRSRDPASLEQFGIFQVSANLEDLGQGYSAEDDYDEDLEAELAQLTGGNDIARPTRKAPPVPTAQLDAMVSQSMKDIDADAELSGDEDDPDLLNELREITGEDASPMEATEEEEAREAQPEMQENERIMEVLQERLKMYRLAETRAKCENESAKCRRFGRGVKRLEEMLASARSGKRVLETDIPPDLPPSATGGKKGEPVTSEDAGPAVISAPEEKPFVIDDVSGASPAEEASEEAPEEEKSSNVDRESLDLLKKRQQEYKVAAVLWKKCGNLSEALNNVKTAKQFDIVLAAVEAGETIDLSDMPPSPKLPGSLEDDAKEESETQRESAEPAPPPAPSSEASVTGEAIAGALKERLEVYRRTKIAAEEENNSSKARRYGRICKQFEDAIKMHARGKPVAFDELPVPPGFPPIGSQAPTPAAAPTTTDPASQEKEKPSEPAPAPVPPRRIHQGEKKGAMSRAEKQALMLQRRQGELKQAALAAKKDGDMELARDYLRQAKGITPLIEASKSGLPVDLNSIPLSPNAKNHLNTSNLVDAKSDDSFTLVSSVDCLEEASGTDQQIYENMEKQLLKQAKWCLSTRDHSKALGDVAGYNRWERLALGYSHDLDMLRVRKRDGLPPPQHHYEVKTYAIVQSCTDLSDTEAEISIIRGINYSKDFDTYVMLEYPYPTENPQTNRTSTIRETNNPEYAAVFLLESAVDRSARQCQRVFKRHSLKCQVWSKGCSMNPILCCTHPRGFFRSDSLVGTVTVKLAPLESQCILHDSFPLMDGRKAVGGKLEVKIRLRNPILTKQIDKITDKWLTID